MNWDRKRESKKMVKFFEKFSVFMSKLFFLLKTDTDGKNKSCSAHHQLFNDTKIMMLALRGRKIEVSEVWETDVNTEIMVSSRISTSENETHENFGINAFRIIENYSLYHFRVDDLLQIVPLALTQGSNVTEIGF